MIILFTFFVLIFSETHNIPGFFLPNEESVFIHEEKAYVKDSKRVIVFVHGAGQHLETYKSLAGEFNSHGVSVYLYSQRCHGLSTGGALFYDLKDFSLFSKDLKFILENRIEDEFDEIFIVGHSMGTLVSLYTDIAFEIKKINPRVKGIILAANAIQVSATNVQCIDIYATKVLNFLIPWIVVTHGNPPERITKNEHFINQLNSDPLLQTTDFTASFAGLFLQGQEYVLNHLEQVHDSVDLLLLHGLKDEVTPLKGVNLIKERATGVNSIETILYPNFMHELFLDDEELLVHDCMEWMNKK